MKKRFILFLLLIARLLVKGEENALIEHTLSKAKTIITGESKKQDGEVTLICYKGIIRGAYKSSIIEVTVPIVKGRFKIILPDIGQGTYFDIVGAGFKSKSMGPIVEKYLIESGDSVHVDFQIGVVKYSGKSGIKLKCQNDIGSIKSFAWKKPADAFKYRKMDSWDVNYLKYRIEQIDSLYNLKFNSLSSYRNKLPAGFYSRLYVDLSLEKAARFYSDVLRFIRVAKNKDRVDSLILFYNSFTKPVMYRNETEAELVSISRKFDESVWNKFQCDIIYSNYKLGVHEIDNADFFQIIGKIRDEYKGSIRERLVVSACYVGYTYITYKGTEDEYELLNECIYDTKSQFFKDVLVEFADANTKGRSVLNFELPDPAGDIVRLSDFKGKVVFIDFWYTGCTACAKYYKQIVSKVEERFIKDTSVVFITISPDKDWGKWLASVESNTYTSKRVVNLNAGKGEYIMKKYQVTGFPRPYLLDRDLKIYSANRGELWDEEKLVALIKAALSEKCMKED